MGTKNDLNKMCTAANNYSLGDELTAVYTDLSALSTRSNLAKNTICLSKPTFAEGTNAATIKCNAFVYKIAGSVYEKATTDNIAMSSAAAQASGTVCLYGISINATGTVAVTKGTEGTALGTSYPTLPSASVFAALMSVTTVAATFTSGTTDLSATGITAAFFDLNGVGNDAFSSDASVTMTTPA